VQRLRVNITWLLVLISPILLVSNIHAQIFVNNGAQVTVKEDALVGILGGLLVDEGSFDNGGYVWIDGDCENNDTITGFDKIAPIPSSTYVLRGDWINNGIFIASQGLVEMDTTLEQLITGSNFSVFHNLSLLGSDLYNVKRQTIDAFIDPTGTLEINDAELATDNSNMFVTNRANTAVTHADGFVSSLGDAYISWEMDAPVMYEFPVGSSLGTLRKRVAQLTPGSGNLNAMGVRFANVDATTEGYDVDLREQQICDINRLYYHRLYQLSGTDDMDIDLQYVSVDDGDWNFLVNWENSPAREWSESNGSSSNGLFVSVDNWSAFADTAFAYGRPLQAILTASPASICAGDDATLTVSGTTGPALISWLEPIDPTLPSGAVILPLSFDVSPTQTTQYVVEVTANNCTVTDTVVVVVEDPAQLSISISSNSAGCDNSNYIFTADTSGGGQTAVISWLVNGAVQPGENGIQFILNNPNAGDVVRAEYTTLAGCSGSASSNPISVTIGDAVSVTLSGDDLICVPQDESIGLFTNITYPDGADISISWASEAELSCNTGCSATYVTPVTGDTVWVYVTVVDLNTGCADSDSIQVCGLDVPGIYIPTAFTPDGDTDNDDLYILGDLDEFDLDEFRVYNRWGELVFSASTFDTPWDGTFKGEDQEMDVYVYYVSATFLENLEKRELKGNVLLLR